MRFQRKMPSVDQANLRIGKVTPESLCTLRQEERIVFPPHRKGRRLMGAKVLLKTRVGSHVRFVVAEEIELDVIVAGAIEPVLIEGVALRRNRGHIRLAVMVLELSRSGLQERSQVALVFLTGVLPVRADRIPALAQTLLAHKSAFVY